MVDVDPGVSRKTQAGLAIGGGVLLAIVAAIAIWLLVKLGKGAGKVADDVADIASDITGAAKDLVGGTRRVGTVAGGLATGSGGSDLNQDAKDFDEKRDQLKIRVVSKKDKKVLQGVVRAKRTDVDLQVVNARTGQGVPYAVLRGKFSFAATQAAQGRNVKSLVTDAQGYYRRLYWVVANVAVTDKEDDLVFHAEKNGFNPSQKLTLG